MVSQRGSTIFLVKSCIFLLQHPVTRRRGFAKEDKALKVDANEAAVGVQARPSHQMQKLESEPPFIRYQYLF